MSWMFFYRLLLSILDGCKVRMAAYFNRLPRIWVTFSLFLLISGCGGGSDRLPMAVVTGSVKVGEEPAVGALVTFQQTGASRVSSGKTDADGKFELTTYTNGDGAFIGLNSVTIASVEVNPVMEEIAKLAEETKAKRYSTNREESDQATREYNQKTAELMAKHAKLAAKKKTGGKDKDERLIPLKYSKVGTSGLEYTVVGGRNHFDFALDKK